MAAIQPEVQNSGGAMIVPSSDQTGLTVHWENGRSGTFHYLWLRDCCYCDACGDSESSLRRYVPGAVPCDIHPASCNLEGGDLVIQWSHDGHLSRYDLAWLYDNRYDAAALEDRKVKPALWDSHFDARDVSFDYQSVSSDDNGRIALYRALAGRGFAVIKGGPQEAGSVTRIANLVGEVTRAAYGDVFDLAPSNSVGTAGTTTREVPPHTDEAFSYTPPGILTLACVREAEDGGDTILVDGFEIVEKLRRESPQSVALLAQWNHSFIRRHPGRLDQRAEMPVITLDQDGSVAGLRLHTRSTGPLKLPPDVMPGYLRAYHRLCALMMAPENQIRLKLSPGDAAVFDNHRILHSRTAFTDQRRFLQICSVMRERFHENYRLLADRLGYEGEANCILGAGAVR